MNPTWKSFLVKQGAVLEAERLRHFGDPTQETHTAAQGLILADLSNHALIRAQGEDTAVFLNGQLSNDIHALDGTHSQLAAWCNPKGRMMAIFRVFRRGDDYLLQCPATLQENILKRLRMFVLRAKVKLESLDNELVAIGLSGPKAETHLSKTTGFAPGAINNCETRDEISILNLPGPHPRFEIVAPTSTAMDLWTKLKAQAKPVGSSGWAWLDIMAGIPSIYPETQEAFVPQMTNLETVGGVNFKKGCYPGQEIVARMQFLGKLKQRMYRAHFDSEPAPRPGDSVFAPDFPGQAAGTVVDAQTSPEGGIDLLAVIQISSATAGKIHLSSEKGPQLVLQTLPYSLPTAKEK